MESTKTGLTASITGQQVSIYVSDSIVPENVATIDKGAMTGNAVSKEQLKKELDEKSEDLDKKIAVIQEQVKTDFKGVLKPSDIAPTEDGSYKPSVSSEDDKVTNPSDWGTKYPNANNLRAKKGYDTMFYKKGTIWTKSESQIPGVLLADSFDPENQDKAQNAKQIVEYFEFKNKSFDLFVDFTRDNYSKYTELLGTTTLNELAGGKFGTISYMKLTGGNLIMPTSFVAQLGSAEYDPSKTNVIAFWKEYDKVRYFNEVFSLEPLPTDGIITFYNFQGKPANALLSSIIPTGNVFSGNISNHSIDNTGRFLRRLNNATSGASAIGVHTNGKTAYKATFIMSLYDKIDVLIAGNTYDDYINYITVQTSLRRVSLKTQANPTGTVIATSPNIPYPQVDWYLWEFVVEGHQVKFYCNNNFICEYTNPNSGDYFSFILNRTEDGVKAFKIETF